ncbi:hypothetical protein BS47DRAFT_1340260, partial [Hydnum rufescens UP504]
MRGGGGPRSTAMLSVAYRRAEPASMFGVSVKLIWGLIHGGRSVGSGNKARGERQCVITSQAAWALSTTYCNGSEGRNRPWVICDEAVSELMRHMPSGLKSWAGFRRSKFIRTTRAERVRYIPLPPIVIPFLLLALTVTSFSPIQDSDRSLSAPMRDINQNFPLSRRNPHYQIIVNGHPSYEYRACV